MWWNDQVKTGVKREEDVWKVLGARDEDSWERCLEAYKEEKRKVKGAFIKVRKRSKNSLAER